MSTRIDSLPKAFIWRRLHSLSGMWLVLFLLEHLITNSQAALLLGESGKGFVRGVNFIHSLPYLTVIEVTLLGFPILLHMIWGIRYLFTAKYNSFGLNDSTPHLKYSRNHAYTWQRITSWILVVLLIVHVVKFRFLEYPHTVNEGSNPTYFVKVQMDPGLYTVADRLEVKLYDAQALREMKQEGAYSHSEEALINASKEIREKKDSSYDEQDDVIMRSMEKSKEKQQLIEALSSVHLKEGQVLATACSFGTTSLLTVRDTFKSWFWVGVYTVFVLSACFHAFNGLWTSMLTWGWVIKTTAQTHARRVAIGLMLIIAFLGLAAVWGTYFLNLKN